MVSITSDISPFLFYTNDIIQLVAMFFVVKIKESPMEVHASGEYRSRLLAVLHLTFPYRRI